MIKYFVWLQLCLGAGNKKISKIFEKIESPEVLYKIKDREKFGIFSPKELEKMQSIHLGDAMRIVADCKVNGIEIITYGSEKYPYCLSVIDNPPLVLYVKGKMPDFDNIPAICIVGPRRVSEFGKKAAFSLGFRLAAAGMTVVSGGALGTDTNAHAGALRAEGKTVLIMGSGILSSYLPENSSLRNAVSKNGCLISEHPPRVEITKGSFPVRNRLLSALSLGTVIVEAGNRSGALITARYAYEQGRDVFVIPGSPEKQEYSGSNALLRDGAKPLLDASDIFNEYIVRFPDKINIERAYSKSPKTVKCDENIKINEKNQKNLNISLSKEAKIVYNHLDKQFFLPEEINNTGLSANQLLSALTELEMEFLIEALPGGRYKKL